jgi:hypothetical protein
MSSIRLFKLDYRIALLLSCILSVNFNQPRLDDFVVSQIHAVNNCGEQASLPGLDFEVYGGDLSLVKSQRYLFVLVFTLIIGEVKESLFHVLCDFRITRINGHFFC